MDWAGVHAALEARRNDLDLIKAAWYKRIGIGETTYSKMAKGIGIAKSETRRAVARRAGFTPTSIDDALAGGKMKLARPSSRPALDTDFESRLVRLEEGLDLLLEHLGIDIADLVQRRGGEP